MFLQNTSIFYYNRKKLSCVMKNPAPEVQGFIIRISISKRFKDKGFIYIVHFLWFKYSTLFSKMIVYSLNEL